MTTPEHAKTEEDSREARIVYGHGKYEIFENGAFVVCAVTGNRILLPDLKYWSVDRQEAYSDAYAVLIAHQKAQATAQADEDEASSLGFTRQMTPDDDFL